MGPLGLSDDKRLSTAGKGAVHPEWPSGRPRFVWIFGFLKSVNPPINLCSVKPACEA
jgi:hypothetical protein